MRQAIADTHRDGVSNSRVFSTQKLASTTAAATTPTATTTTSAAIASARISSATRIAMPTGISAVSMAGIVTTV